MKKKENISQKIIKQKEKELEYLTLFLDKALELKEDLPNLEVKDYEKKISDLILKHKAFFIKNSLSTFINPGDFPNYLNQIIGTIENQVGKLNEYLDRELKKELINIDLEYKEELSKDNKIMQNFTFVLAFGVILQMLAEIFKYLTDMNSKTWNAYLGILTVYIALLIVLIIIFGSKLTSDKKKFDKVIDKIQKSWLVRGAIGFGLLLMVSAILYPIQMDSEKIIVSNINDKINQNDMYKEILRLENRTRELKNEITRLNNQTYDFKLKHNKSIQLLEINNVTIPKGYFN